MSTKVESWNASKAVKYPAGQRLQCRKCGSEVEIVIPCSCHLPDQHHTCCGREMVPTIGNDVHLNVE